MAQHFLGARITDASPSAQAVAFVSRYLACHTYFRLNKPHWPTCLLIIVQLSHLDARALAVGRGVDRQLAVAIVSRAPVRLLPLDALAVLETLRGVGGQLATIAVSVVVVPGRPAVLVYNQEKEGPAVGCGRGWG